jgi:hypothetical protein
MKLNNTDLGLSGSSRVLGQQGMAPSASVTDTGEVSAVPGNMGTNAAAQAADSLAIGQKNPNADSLGIPPPVTDKPASRAQLEQSAQRLQDAFGDLSNDKLKQWAEASIRGASEKQAAVGSTKAPLPSIVESFESPAMASQLEINTLLVQVQAQNRKQNRDDMKAAMDGLQKTTEATVAKMEKAAEARFTGQMAGAVIGALGGFMQAKISFGGAAGNAGMAQATKAQGVGQVFSSISQMATAIGENIASAADREVKVLESSSQRLEKQYQEANSAADAAGTAIQAGRDTVRALLDASVAKNVAQNI